MIADPYFLERLATANASIASAMENISSDCPGYEEIHGALVDISKSIEALIIREVTR